MFCCYIYYRLLNNKKQLYTEQQTNKHEAEQFGCVSEAFREPTEHRSANKPPTKDLPTSSGLIKVSFDHQLQGLQTDFLLLPKLIGKC